MTQVQLYNIENRATGVEQVWYDWPPPLPRAGEYIRLDEGDWRVKQVIHHPGEGHVAVYAVPP